MISLLLKYVKESLQVQEGFMSIPSYLSSNPTKLYCLKNEIITVIAWKKESNQGIRKFEEILEDRRWDGRGFTTQTPEIRGAAPRTSRRQPSNLVSMNSREQGGALRQSGELTEELFESTEPAKCCLCSQVYGTQRAEPLSAGMKIYDYSHKNGQLSR